MKSTIIFAILAIILIYIRGLSYDTGINLGYLFWGFIGWKLFYPEIKEYVRVRRLQHSKNGEE